jgi:hypothetical protein
MPTESSRTSVYSSRRTRRISNLLEKLTVAGRVNTFLAVIGNLNLLPCSQGQPLMHILSRLSPATILFTYHFTHFYYVPRRYMPWSSKYYLPFAYGDKTFYAYHLYASPRDLTSYADLPNRNNCYYFEWEVYLFQHLLIEMEV